jgi:hypothetical protein
MSTMPKRRSHASGISRILDTQIFICSGKAKYGSPSIIMTIPSTQRKKSIGSSIHFSSQGNITPELVVFLQNGHPDRGLAQRRKKIARPLTVQSGSRPLSNNQSMDIRNVLGFRLRLSMVFFPRSRSRRDAMALPGIPRESFSWQLCYGPRGFVNRNYQRQALPESLPAVLLQSQCPCR